jgi:hypothetical protein
MRGWISLTPAHNPSPHRVAAGADMGRVGEGERHGHGVIDFEVWCQHRNDSPAGPLDRSVHLEVPDRAPSPCARRLSVRIAALFHAGRFRRQRTVEHRMLMLGGEANKTRAVLLWRCAGE